MFVHYGHHLQPPTILGLIHREVIAPDVVDVFGTPPGAANLRASRETPSFTLFGRDLQVRLPPEPLNTLLVDCPALPSEKDPRPPVAVARVLPTESKHLTHQSCVFTGLRRDVALAGAGLTHYYPTSPTL